MVCCTLFKLHRLLFLKAFVSFSPGRADAATASTDLIDLSVLRLRSEIPRLSVEKAEKAYPVIEPLKKAIKNFQKEPIYRDKCFSELQVRNRVNVINGLDLLASDFGIPLTKRSYSENI